MALSIELAVHERLKICGKRCENTFPAEFREEPKRCPNEHGKRAETYKGIVILTPFYKHKNQGDIEKIRMWCHKCHKEYAIKKHAKKPKPRVIKIDKDQTDLFK